MSEPPPDPVIVGRSSSHFTRLVRIFALELEVNHQFRPVLDISSRDAATFADNPALKIPILLDERGPLFGSENICRELLRRSGWTAARVLLRGAIHERIVLNCEELVLHAMSAEVALIMGEAAGTGHSPPPKLPVSLDNSLLYLNERWASLLAALPAPRALSFVEAGLFSVITHLTFRKLRDVERWPELAAFCRHFARRASAQATEYRFDAV